MPAATEPRLPGLLDVSDAELRAWLEADGEKLEQLIRLRNLPGPGGADGVRRLTHIVVMGMGEPLANLDNLLEALEAATSPDGLGIGARHVTISTVGLPAKIRRLAEVGKQ